MSDCMPLVIIRCRCGYLLRLRFKHYTHVGVFTNFGSNYYTSLLIRIKIKRSAGRNDIQTNLVRKNTIHHNRSSGKMFWKAYGIGLCSDLLTESSIPTELEMSYLFVKVDVFAFWHSSVIS